MQCRARSSTGESKKDIDLHQWVALVENAAALDEWDSRICFQAQFGHLVLQYDLSRAAAFSTKAKH